MPPQPTTGTAREHALRGCTLRRMQPRTHGLHGLHVCRLECWAGGHTPGVTRPGAALVLQPLQPATLQPAPDWDDGNSMPAVCPCMHHAVAHSLHAADAGCAVRVPISRLAGCRVFGWTSKNEINNGRWVMFGLMVGMLTEYATGVDFPHQLALMGSYLGIVDMD